nr:hypothetical protein [uncultured Draconibacterium sp.]
MTTLSIENTGLDHLYPDGVPLAEATISISDLYKKIARKTSLAVQADPYFNDKSEAQKLFSELHGEGDRITRDFLEDAADDILPVFQAMQRWIPETDPGPRFEFDLADSGNIVYRWQIMDTRTADYKLNYTSETLVNIRTDLNCISNVKKYLKNALVDYVLRELYETIGYDKKYAEYVRRYADSRADVAYWAKNDTSLQTQLHDAGV